MWSPLDRHQRRSFRQAQVKVENRCDRSEQTRMGAACTRLDVSPEASKAIRSRMACRHFIIQDARLETVWACIEPYIKGAVERSQIRRLLRRYLEDNPCRDRYLGITLGGRRWFFEIMKNRCGGEYMEILLTGRRAAY